MENGKLKMENEILIDGVDVSGCEFYIADDKYSCDLSFINKEELCNCDNINDCYYKQLQRAKVENKELSESIKRLKNMAKAAALGREKIQTSPARDKGRIKRRYYL